MARRRLQEVPPERLVNLAATLDPMDAETLTLDGLGSILILQQYALIVTDVIVTPRPGCRPRTERSLPATGCAEAR